MKTQTLDELMGKIEKLGLLPLKVRNFSIIDKIITIEGAGRGRVIFVDNDDVPTGQGQFLSQYTVHAANNFPKLVEALKYALDCLSVLDSDASSGSSSEIRNFSIGISKATKEVRAALSAANEIK